MSFLQSFDNIRCFAFDVDGVLTDGTILVFESGEQVRRMNIKDGYALQLAVKKGYRVVVVSGADSPGVNIRLQRLGVTDCFFKIDNKKAFLEQYLKERSIGWKEVLMMGDDLPDLEAMTSCGLPAAPQDAVAVVRQAAAYISPFGGGQGCVRDVIEKVLQVRGHWTGDGTIASK